MLLGGLARFLTSLDLGQTVKLEHVRNLCCLTRLRSLSIRVANDDLRVQNWKLTKDLSQVNGVAFASLGWCKLICWPIWDC